MEIKLKSRKISDLIVLPILKPSWSVYELNCVYEQELFNEDMHIETHDESKR